MKLSPVKTNNNKENSETEDYKCLQSRASLKQAIQFLFFTQEQYSLDTIIEAIAGHI